MWYKHHRYSLNYGVKIWTSLKGRAGSEYEEIKDSKLQLDQYFVKTKHMTFKYLRKLVLIQ